MASDGTIKINTELDSSQAQAAMSKFSGIASKAMSGVKIAVGAASAAITAMAGYSIKVGSDFEAGMSQVSAVSGATGEELEALTEKAKEMGAKTKFSATEAAEAMNYMAMAGWKTSDMLNGIEEIMNLAAASGENLGTTADIVTDALTAFGLSAQDSTHFADVLAAASSNANTNVGMMGETFKYIAPVAGAMGYSVEDCSLAIGLMANSGIKAGQAGTALRSMLSRLAKPTDEVQGAMDKLGVSLTNSDGSMKSLNEVMGDMREGFSGLSKAEQTQTASALAGQEAMSGLLAIVNASDSDFSKLQSAINNADGSAASMAETMNDNLKGSITIAGSAAESFGIAVYEKMEKPLKSVVDKGTEDINQLTSAFQSGGLNAVVEEAGAIFNDTADDIAGMSDAAAGVVTPIKNIVNVGGTLTKAVLPVAADGVKLLAENMDTITPLVIGAGTAFKAYNTIGKATATATKANAAATAVLNTLEKKNAITLVAMNGGLTLRQALLAVYNGQITVTTALTGLWTKAQTALNTAMNANPIGLAVAATAALVAIGLAAKSSVEKQTEAERKHSNALRENVKAAEENLQKAKERKQAYEEFAQSQNEQAAGDVAQLDRLASLNQELGTIVDSTGKVKAGEEDRAAFITSQLSSALGIEISLTDGQIQNYQQLQDEIAKTIQQKRIEAVMSAQEAKYQEAVNNQMQAAAEASANYTAMKKAESAVEEENTKLDSLIEQKNQAVIDGNKALVSSLDAKIQKQKEDVQNAEDAYDKNKKAYKESAAALEEYASDIDAYTALAEAAASGNADAIEEAITRITSGIKTASNATNEELQNQVVEVSNMEDLIRQEVEKGTPGFTQAMLDQASQSSVAALEEFAKVAPQTADELAKVPPEAVAALIAGDMKGQLSSEAKGAVDGMLAQFDDLDSDTQEAFANAIYGALKGLEGFDQLEDPAEEGVEAFLDSLKSALDEHSPSKKTEEIFKLAMDGAANGVESGKEGVLTKAGDFITAFIGKFSDTELGQTLTTVGQNFMSFFGLGVSSKTEDSKNAGKANADAAQVGAGSVNPFATGSSFGAQFNGGVGGVAKAAGAAGKIIANSAKSGAGQVTPSNEGSKFGNAFSRAVSGASGASRSSGRSLGDSARSGAGSVSGYDPGSNFGSGFVRGISAWIGNAVNAAANLASAALSKVKQTLGIASPSKEMKKVGRFFDAGLEKGISDNAEYAVKAAEQLSGNVLDAVNMSGMYDQLQGLDIPEVMSGVYDTMDRQKERVAQRVTRAVTATENQKWKTRDGVIQTTLSDGDIKRLARAFAQVASSEIMDGLDNVKFVVGQREFGRLVREEVRGR